MSSTASDPQPVVDGRGATILGPRNAPLERQNPDVLISPVTDAGTIPNLKWPFAMSRNRVLTGGFARETTARELPISTEIAGVDMRLTPGGIRELHWHKEADEWQYWLKGEGRMTVFASGGKSRTFDYQAGDVGVAPRAMGHYVENTGDETLVFLGLFRSDHYADVSLSQWMGVLPPELVKAHLNLDDDVVGGLPRTKRLVVG